VAIDRRHLQEFARQGQRYDLTSAVRHQLEEAHDSLRETGYALGSLTLQENDLFRG
jgi:hypothetical protein